MADEKELMVQKLAQGNPVELSKILTVQQQLAELERAGIHKKSEYGVERPLGRTPVFETSAPLANAGGLTRR